MKSVLLFHLAPIYLFLFQNILVNHDSVIYDKKNFQEGPSSAFTIKVIPAQEKTYGYEIYQGKKAGDPPGEHTRFEWHEGIQAKV